MVTEIIAVGTELLTGDTVNTNASFIASELQTLGAGCVWQSVVGDNPERMTSALQTALKRSELIILTGGLGPTEDDITKEIAASLLGLPLFEDAKCMADIASFFERRGKEMPEINRKQAKIPKGSVILENEVGTAPGIIFDFEILKNQGKFYSQYKAAYLVLLPGPPVELKPMWNDSAKPYLREKLKTGALISHYLSLFGIGESAAAELMGEILSGKNPTVSPYVKNGRVKFRISASAENEEKAEALISPVLEEMKKRAEGYVAGVDITSIASEVVSALLKAGKTVSTAESCTGGYISKKITDISGSSEVFGLTAVTYSNKAKQRLLGVKPETLDAFGAVSEETAVEMAKGAVILSGADYGLSITGVAGPSSSEGKPVGTVYVGLCSRATGALYSKKFIFGHGIINEREYIREISSETALWELLKLIRSEN